MENEFDFWKLSDSQKIRNLHDFLELIESSAHLVNYEYVPERLEWSTPRNRRISEMTFERFDFSDTIIEGFVFRRCKFVECLFIRAQTKNCEFHDCTFETCNTHKIDFTNTYINPVSFNECLDEGKHQNIGVHLYQKLMNNSRNTGQMEFGQYAQFFFKRWKRYQDLYEVKKLCRDSELWKTISKLSSYVVRLLFEIFLGSGIRVRYLLRFLIGLIILFWSVNYYYVLEFGLQSDSGESLTVVNVLYYTVISLPR